MRLLTIILPTTATINLRQINASISFATIENGLTSATVSINTAGVTAGAYDLVFESYDVAAPSTRLKTDTVTIQVYEFVRSSSSTIKNTIVILKGSSESFPVDHVASTIILPTTPKINLKQSS